MGTGGVGGFSEGGDGHEPGDGEVREREDFGEGLIGDVGVEAEFGVIAGDVDLEETAGGEIEFGGDAAEVAGEVEGIERVEEVGEREDFADFVGLEVPDEVPVEGGGEERDFGEGFLDAAFAEDGLAGGDGGGDGVRGEGFGDRAERDGVRGAAGEEGGGGEAFAEGGEAIGDGGRGHEEGGRRKKAAAVAEVEAARASSDEPRRAAMCEAVRLRKAGSLRLPRWGTGGR